MAEKDEELGSNLFDTEPQPPKRRKAQTKRVPDEDRTWIVLEENSDIPPTGLPLSVNGDVCMIMAGEPVHIPNKYLEVLDHAIMSMPQLDGSQRVIGVRDRHRFPYRKVDAPAVDE